MDPVSTALTIVVTAVIIRRIYNMDENLDSEFEDMEDPEWKEYALEIGTNFCMVYGAIALVRDVASFVCRK